MRLTTLSPKMGGDITATNQDDFAAELNAKYAFIDSANPGVVHKGAKKKAKPIEVEACRANVMKRVVNTMQNNFKSDNKLVASTGIISGLYLTRVITSEPVMRQKFEPTRDVEDTPQPAANTAFDTRKSRSLRGFLKTKDVVVKTAREARKFQIDWYAHGCPEQYTERSAPDTQRLPFEVSDTVYIRNYNRAETKFGRNVGFTQRDEYVIGSIFQSFRSLWDMPRVEIRKDLYIKVFREKTPVDEKTMHPGTDLFGMQPIGKFFTGKKAPQRSEAEIDFLECVVSTLNHKQKVWWAGEVYRVNIRKDGMRRVSEELKSKIAEHFGISKRMVMYSASSTAPLMIARGGVAAYVKPKAEISEKGSGFVGITGDWEYGSVTIIPYPWETLVPGWYTGGWKPKQFTKFETRKLREELTEED